MKNKGENKIEKDEVTQAIDELMEKEFDLTFKPENKNMPSESMPIIDENKEEYNGIEKSEEAGDITVDEYETQADCYNIENSFQNNLASDEENENFEDKKASKNKMYLSYNMRLLINGLGIFVFALLSIVLFVFSISIKTRSSVLYRQSSNLDYKVYLKQNSYYKEPYLQKNMQYIASLIDNVDVNFNYNFNVNQNIDYKYTFYVQADIAVTSSEDKSKIIYSKTDKLTQPSTIIKENSNGFNISQNVNINYDKYNNLVKGFKSSYAINANSNLILSLFVEIEDEKGNKIKSLDKDTIKLTIPLTEQMIDISMDSNEINNSNNVNIYKDFNISNKITFLFAIISLITAVVFIIRLMLFLKKTSAKKTIYDVTLSKILREYDRVIVNSKKIIDLNQDVIDVKNFNELLDVRDNLEKPIIFSEVHKGQKSVFIVKTPNETYRYILKFVDLQNNQEKK